MIWQLWLCKFAIHTGIFAVIICIYAEYAGATMQVPDWECLKTFVVLCRAGNMSAAARELGVNQTTVSRRIARLETILGYPVLRRGDGEMVPTSPAKPLLATAQEMEANIAAVLAATPKAGDGAPDLTGTVRVTAVDAILYGVLLPAFGDFHHRYPGVQLDLIGGNRNLNIARRETDLALRMAMPESGAFRARRLGDMQFAVYGPHRDMDLQQADWIDLVDDFADKPEQQWLQHTFPKRRVLARANNAAFMARLALQCRGCCLLPRCVGDRVKDLYRQDQYQVSAGREVWLLVHQDMAHVPRVRAVMDWVSAVMRAL
jgi:DNA-binding transcriptional LysR family regulator